MQMFYLVWVLCLYLTSTQATPKLRPLSGDIEHVTVKEIQTGRVRVVRSVKEDCHFPPTLQFQFKLNKEKIIINLEKNVYLSRRIPIYVTNNGRSYKKETSDENEFAAYQDVTRGSAMLVCCQDDGTFRLHGSFRHGDVMYHMSHSNVPEPSPVHYIQRNHENTNQFKNDFVMPPDYVKEELQNPRNASRQKRADIPGGNIVELLFTTDRAFYQYFLDDQGTDAAARVAIEQYTALLANEIDLYYCSVDMVDPTLSIKIYLAGVEIPEIGTDVSWSTSSQAVVNGVTYLDFDSILPNIKTWYSSENNLPQHDHLMGLSMIDLADITTNPVGTGIEGVAYVGTVCYSTRKVSFSEVDGSRVALIAAHELGHGLNAYHDETGASSSCSSSAKNIMSAYFSERTSFTYAEAQWTFSSCSVAAFKSFINSLGTNCLQQHAFTGDDFEALQAKSLPGTVYSLDQQCQMYNGLSSYSCDTTISESDCYDGYHCSTGTATADCEGGYNSLYPLAGTPCGAPEDNKWCFRGLCVSRPTDTTSSTTTSTTTSTTSVTSSTSTTSSTPTSTICTTSSTSTPTTSPTTSTSTTSPTTSTTSSTTSTTSSTSTTSPTTSTTTSTSTTSPTTSTTSSTTPTTSSTSTTSPTTSTTTSTSTTSPTTSTTSSTTSTTSSTSTTSPTTSTTTSTSTTSPTTSTTSKTTSTSTSTSTTTQTPIPCNEKKKCCKKINNKKTCCKGSKCCETKHSWSVTTDCFTSCCGSPATTLATVSPYCSQECCVQKKGKTKCCTGRACCDVGFGTKLDCCTLCNEVATTAAPTTTAEPCYQGKCCAEVQVGKKTKKKCCKKQKCCKKSWGKDSICCKTCG